MGLNSQGLTANNSSAGVARAVRDPDEVLPFGDIVDGEVLIRSGDEIVSTPPGGAVAHDLGGALHNADTIAALNAKISDATLDDSGDPRDPNAHSLAGAEHNAATLAALNAKISDANLDDAGDPRDPNAHNHTLADITDDGALAAKDTVATGDIDNDAVDNTKAANMATARIKGRTTAGTGDPEDLTVAQVVAMLALGKTKVVTLGAGKDFTFFNDALDAITNDALAQRGVILAYGDTTTDADATIIKPTEVLGIFGATGNDLPEINLANEVIFKDPGADTKFASNIRFTNTKLKTDVGVFHIAQQGRYLFENCHLSTGSDFIRTDLSVTGIKVRMRDCVLKTDDATDVIINHGAFTTEMVLTLENCTEDPTSAAGFLLKGPGTTGKQTVQLNLQNTKITSLRSLGSPDMQTVIHRDTLSEGPPTAGIDTNATLRGRVSDKPTKFTYFSSFQVLYGEVNTLSTLPDTQGRGWVTIYEQILPSVASLGSAGVSGRLIDAELSNEWYAIIHAVDAEDNSVGPAGYFVNEARFNGTYIADLEAFGYTHFALVGWVRNSGVSTLVPFFKEGDTYEYDTPRTNLQALTGGAATTKTVVDLSDFCPPGTKSVMLGANLDPGGNGDYAGIARGDTVLTIVSQFPNQVGCQDQFGAGYQRQYLETQVDASRQIAYINNDASNLLDLFVVGCKIGL